VWDIYTGGGFTSSDVKALQLKSPKVKVKPKVKPKMKPADMHHPDYREEFELRDEPYRY
jgi:hypothetical protein